MAEDHKELQLLPAPNTASSPSRAAAQPSISSVDLLQVDSSDGPSVDLQLSISVLRPMRQASDSILFRRSKDFAHVQSNSGSVDAMKRQAAEQIQLATIEKAYAERVQELSRREMQLAETEFAKAKAMWERAKEEVEQAERLKARATRRVDPTCMEMTCLSCRQKFQP